MHIRLWFWSRENSKPRIIAHGDGRTLQRAMAGCFAPVWSTAWVQEQVGDQLYLRRLGAGYMGEPSGGPGLKGFKVRRRRENVLESPQKRVRERVKLTD